MATLTITLSTDDVAALTAYRLDVLDPGTSAPRYATVAELCAGLFSQYCLQAAHRAHPGDAQATTSSALATAQANFEAAFAPTLTATLT